MRRLVLATPALVVALAVVSAAASAAPSPTLGAADGVSVKATGTAIQVRFTGAAAVAAAAYVGRDLDVVCERHPAPGPLFTDASADSGDRIATLKRAADGTLTLDEHVDGGPYDVCAVQRPESIQVVGHRGPFAIETGLNRPPLARGALTPAGATWIEELGHVTTLLATLQPLTDVAAYPLPTAFAPPGVVALDGPDGTPPAGAIGYWSDGARHALVATTSAAGRRLFYEDLGDGMTRTNTASFEAAAMDRAYVLDTRRSDPDARPFKGRRHRKATAQDGVRATLAGTRLTVRFTGRSAAALRAVAGRRVSVTCNSVRRPSSVLGIGALLDSYRRVTVRAPRRGTTLRARVRAGAADVCAIADDGNAVTAVTPTAAGRALVTDFQAASMLLGGPVLAPAGARTYPPAAKLVAEQKDQLVALPGPDAFPPAGRRAGVWTGGDRVVVAVTSPTGHRFVAADEGDGVLRSDTDVLFLLGLQLASGE